MKALACRETLALTEDLMMTNVVIACDCKQIVENIFLRETVGKALTIRYKPCSLYYKGNIKNILQGRIVKKTSKVSCYATEPCEIRLNI